MVLSVIMESPGAFDVLNLWTSCSLVLASQGVLLSLLIIGKGVQSNTSNFRLGLVVVSYCVIVLTYAIIFLYQPAHRPSILDDGFIRIILFTIGPLNYLYIFNLLGQGRYKTVSLLHFFPALITTGGILGEYLGLFYLGQLYQFVFDPYTLIVHLILYGFGIGVFLKRNHSRFGNLLRNWVTILFAVYLFLTLFISLNLNTIMVVYSDILTLGTIGAFVLILGYVAYFHPKILWDKNELKKAGPPEKYCRSGLSQELSEELKNKLLRLIEEEKLYLNNDLTLDNLANRLSIPRHYVSQIINEQFEMGFYDFINRFRIEEAKTLLKNQEDCQLKVIEIVYQTGFNNKVSFYKAFKKSTGHTPKRYVELSISA